MQINRKALAALSLATPTLLVLTLAPGTAGAHGTMNNPPSRTMVCYAEGPEAPKSDACKKAVQVGGTQALYDWNEVNIGTAAGRHRELIPDGRLCSAGRDKYRGFDQARADWPATTMSSGAKHTFRFRATAPHRGTFELYLTKDGYNPAQPLKWSDLEAKPFHTQKDPALSGGSYVMDAQLPAKKGHHLIYAVWQRSDSPEAFYSCSDVVFGGGNDNPAPTPSGTPTATPKPTPTPTTPGASLEAVDAGVGVAPAAVRTGAQVKVTAVCASGVRAVASQAFTPVRTPAPAGATAWTPALKAAKAGAFPVIVTCKDGGSARTKLTVTAP
ncbi:lytic polysaccharide monooxygenase auxiliary activity family 9 protein [Nonomuraea typhae]|uniref:lytic polysaccharide monooxygenase auxiliary activity family 9 protein n=1 Tax=Nonomuraea typhae TaxID=2603600 RepID=UPI0015E22B3C|nr:lytic polysaccharide monooxygenase [Nonomuraea typhae]